MFKIILIMAHLITMNLLPAASPSLSFGNGQQNGFAAISLSAAEETALNNSINSLLFIDGFCSEYLMVHNDVSSPTIFNMANSAIDPLVRSYDKGAPIDELGHPFAYTTIYPFLSSIMARSFSINSGNIRGWIIIRRLDLTNFKVEVVWFDLLNNTERVDVEITDLTGNPSQPESLSFANGGGVGSNVVINGLTRTASKLTHTFDDPPTAVGADYEIELTFFDGANVIVATRPAFNLTVQAI